MLTLVRDRSAARSGQMHYFVPFESGFLAPFPILPHLSREKKISGEETEYLSFPQQLRKIKHIRSQVYEERITGGGGRLYRACRYQTGTSYLEFLAALRELQLLHNQHCAYDKTKNDSRQHAILQPAIDILHENGTIAFNRLGVKQFVPLRIRLGRIFLGLSILA